MTDTFDTPTPTAEPFGIDTASAAYDTPERYSGGYGLYPSAFTYPSDFTYPGGTIVTLGYDDPDPNPAVYANDPRAEPLSITPSVASFDEPEPVLA